MLINESIVTLYEQQSIYIQLLPYPSSCYIVCNYDEGKLGVIQEMKKGEIL